VARHGILRGIQWRLHGLRQDVAATRLALRSAPRRVPGMVVRWGRSPLRNGPAHLHEHGAGALAAVLAACEEGDVPVFLAYGTLLGAVREGGFIAHDLDIDLGVLDDAWPRLAPVLDHLRSRGWRIHRDGDEQVTVSHPHHAHINVDLFRFRRHGGALTAQAESEQGTHHYRFPRHLIEPLRPRATPWGFAALVPAEPEAFLAHHYGPDWRTPRPGWNYRGDAASQAEAAGR
jgi:hypothetical protein